MMIKNMRIIDVHLKSTAKKLWMLLLKYFELRRFELKSLWKSSASVERHLTPGRKMHTLFCISLDAGMRLLCRFMLWFECKQHTLVARLIQKSVRILRPGDNLQNGAPLMQMRRYGAQLLNKVVIFVLFPKKKRFLVVS